MYRTYNVCMFRRPATCAVFLLTASIGGEAQTPSPNKQMRALLEQSQALEHRFERRDSVYHNAPLEAHLSATMEALLPATAPAYVSWRFLVLREPMAAVFSLPDGTIYASTGLLSVLENDDQLAGVLAHEIAHVQSGDAFKVQRQYQSKEARRSIAALAAASAPLAGGAAPWPVMLAVNGAGLGTRGILAASGGPVAYCAINGYGDALERHADAAATAALARAGRDQAQLARAYELLARRAEAEPIAGNFGDAGRLRERAALAGKLIAETSGPARGGESYLVAVEPAIQENVLLDIDSRFFRSSVADAERLAAAHPDDPQTLYLLGEAYRRLGPRRREASGQELSPEGQRAAMKERQQHTAAEEERRLAATTEGQVDLHANRDQAEKLFLQAAGRNTQFAQAHLGLGMLFSDEGRVAEARTEFRKFVELAPAAPERGRVERRLVELDAAAGHRPEGR